MLNTIFYLSNKYSDLNYYLSENADKDIHISFLIENTDIEKLQEAYRFFSEKNILQFSLSILVNKTLQEDILYFLISFCFLPGYLKIENEIIINIISTQDELSENFKKSLIEISSRQGIKNLKIHFLIADKYNLSVKSEPNSTFLYTNIDEFMLYYTDTLKFHAKHNEILYLNYSAIEIDKLPDLVQRADIIIKSNNLPYYDMVLRLKLLSLENSNLKIKNISLANELINYKMHVNMLKSAHEATEIQLHYDNEYEILPVWYKRIGHVLKVMMGKRTLKSLFNNNTKKA